MWMWVLIGLDIIAKVHGFADGRANSPSCDSLSPQHEVSSGVLFSAQTSEAPFRVDHERNSNPGDPITVVLRSTGSTRFTGFMLEARAQTDSSPLVGRFILLDTSGAVLLSCSGSADSAVSQRVNGPKDSIRVNWTATEINQDIVFRATFVQSFTTFWENMSSTFTLPTTNPVPSTTTNTPEPSTTTNTPVSSTTTNTPEPSTTTNTPEASTTTNTPATSTTTNTPATSTTTNTPATSTTTNTPATSTTTNTPATSTTTNTPATSTTTNTPATSTTVTTTKQSTTKFSSVTSTVTHPTLSSTTPSITVGIRLNTEERVGTALMCVDCILEEAKMEMSNILAVLLAKGTLYQRLNEASKIVMSTLCLGVEIASLILFCAGDSPPNVVLVGLASAVIVINFLEQVMWSVRIRDKLKQICCIVVKMDFVVHQSFTLAILYVAVLVDWRQNRCECWPLKVLIALTAWIFSAVVWILVFTSQKKAIRKTFEQVALDSDGRSSQKRQKKNLIAARVAVIAISVIFVLGTTSLAIAVIVGVVGCQLG